MFGFERAAFGLSQKLGPGNLFYGGEAYHDDGPWVRPDDYSKFNGLLTYSKGDEANGFSVTGRAYHGQWNSKRSARGKCCAPGWFLRHAQPDGRPANSERYSLQAEWHRSDGNSETQNHDLWIYYDLDLFSDFTYFLTDPSLGDQFRATGQALGGPDWTRGTRFSANGLATATWKIHSACKSA